MLNRELAKLPPTPPPANQEQPIDCIYTVFQGLSDEDKQEVIMLAEQEGFQTVSCIDVMPTQDYDFPSNCRKCIQAINVYSCFNHL